MRPDAPQKWPEGQDKHSEAMERNILGRQRESWGAGLGTCPRAMRRWLGGPGALRVAGTCLSGAAFSFCSCRLPGIPPAFRVPRAVFWQMPEGRYGLSLSLSQDRHLGIVVLFYLNPQFRLRLSRATDSCVWQLQSGRTTALQPLAPLLSPCSGVPSPGGWDFPEGGETGLCSQVRHRQTCSVLDAFLSRA